MTGVRSAVPFSDVRYHYDDADRLTGHDDISAEPQFFRYDPASNPLDTALNIASWPHNRVAQHNDVDYQYDIYGRTTQKSTHNQRWRYRYDSEHRLVEVLHQPISHTQPECVVSFCYDPLGRRISKRVRYQRMNGVTADAEKHSERETRFLWEGPRLLAEFNAGQTQIYAYSDQNSFAPLARIDGAGDDSTIYYFHNRLNGQPEAMTDSEGKACWHGQPDSWGKVKWETHEREIKTGGPQNLRMQGQYLDRETGLHYNLHRYYDPDSGRFTQHDPIGLAGGLNLYAYVPNPLTWIDPLGLSCKTIKTNSRNDALNRAQQHAQVPRISRGGQDFSLNDLNPTSRGNGWGKMKADGAQKLGRHNPNGKNSWFEHPDGHPADAGKLNIPDHHSNGHVHAINTKGEEVIFTW